MIVYKYRNFTNEYQTNALFKQELFFANPNDFNDPHDFSIFPEIPDFSDPEIVKKTAIEITEGHYDYRDLKNFISKKNDLIEKFSDPDKFKADTKNNIRNLNQMYGVCCFSKNWNNITQWAYYADSHKGFTIGFETDDLWRTGYSSYADDIKYVEEYPKIPLVNYFPSNKSTPEKHFEQVSTVIYFTKLLNWKYEDEWRMIKSFWGAKSTDRILKYPIKIIKEIVVGLNISDENMKLVMDFAFKCEIPVFRTAKSENKYDLDRNQIG